MVEVPLLVLVYASVSSWLVETYFEYVGEYLFLEAPIVSHSMVKLVSWVQTFRCVRWCQWLKSVADNVNKEFLVGTNSGQVVGKMKIEKFMTRMDTLGSWIWLVQTEISGSQKYINLHNLRVAKKTVSLSPKSSNKNSPRTEMIRDVLWFRRLRVLLFENWSHLSNRGRFDWWIDLANPGLQPLSSRLL